MRVNGLKGRLWAKTGGIILLSVLFALDAVVLDALRSAFFLQRLF